MKAIKNKVSVKPSVIEQLREIREKLNSNIKDLNHKQLLQYLAKQKTLHPGSNWKK